MNTASSVWEHDCSALQFIEDVRQGLFAGDALVTTAPYVQTMIFEPGCALNNTHVEEMLLRLSNLRVLALRDSSTGKSPLRLPGKAMTKESQLMAIRVIRMGLETIPSEIGRLSETLSIVNIGDNPKLRELPRELGECTKLGILHLTTNAISAVPRELDRLTGLASLDLGMNRLTSLPSTLGSLTNLQSLWLSNNLLNAIPPSFGKMTSLIRLSAASNHLTTVPVLDSNQRAWLNLRYLDLEGNNISTWPNNWAVQKKASVAELPFNTTARAVGDEKGGLYDTYVAHHQYTTGRNSSNGNSPLATGGTLSLLVLMSGNPVMKNITKGRALLLEVNRGSAAEELPRMLVSTLPNCAAGCRSTLWKAGGVRDYRGDSFCHHGCNVSACQFDGGDCARREDVQAV